MQSSFTVISNAFSKRAYEDLVIIRFLKVGALEGLFGKVGEEANDRNTTITTQFRVKPVILYCWVPGVF